MNLVVFGEDMYTAAVIESLVKAGHKVPLLVTPQNRSANFKVLEETAAKFGIEFLRTEDVNSNTVADRIRQWKPDLIISAHLRRILKKEIFSLAKKGAINIHPSLLPKYRGLSPQHQAIMHGDSESGVTIHFIEDEVDTGDIVLQKKFAIEESDYIVHIQAKMLDVYKTIVAEAVALLGKESFNAVKQPTVPPSYFGPLKKGDCKINLSKSTRQVHNLVRAVSLPYQGAFYNNYIIWMAEIAEDDDLKTRYPDVGIYPEEKEERLIIRLHDGILVSEDFEITSNQA